MSEEILIKTKENEKLRRVGRKEGGVPPASLRLRALPGKPGQGEPGPGHVEL